MPKKIHDKLAREAAAKGLKGEAADRYVYGTLHRIESGSASASASASGKSKTKKKKQPTAPHPGHHVRGSGHSRFS